MGKVRTTPFDVADHLRTRREMAAYLTVTLEESGDDAVIVKLALHDVARAQGLAKVARRAGMSRERLRSVLSGRRALEFQTFVRVVRSLGMRLGAEAVDG